MFYRGKELLDNQLLKGKGRDHYYALDIGIVTEAKNEEGMMVKVSVGMLVHTVKKRP